MESVWEEFRRFLQARGLKVTQARRNVFEHVCSRRDHFRADQVAKALSSGSRRVSRGTVYHTLALLAQSGLLLTIRDQDPHTHYEFIHPGQCHDHLICHRCGGFFDFQDEQLERITQSICDQNGFEKHSYRLVVSGICRECRGAKTGDR